MVFYGVKEDTLSVSVGGKVLQTESFYEEEIGCMVLQIPEVDVTEEIQVAFLNKPIIADIYQQKCYEILQRAQMDYGKKEQTWNLIKGKKTELFEVFVMIDIPKSVKACLSEVINAAKGK